MRIINKKLSVECSHQFKKCRDPPETTLEISQSENFKSYLLSEFLSYQLYFFLKMIEIITSAVWSDTI